MLKPASIVELGEPAIFRACLYKLLLGVNGQTEKSKWYLKVIKTFSHSVYVGDLHKGDLCVVVAPRLLAALALDHGQRPKGLH